MLGTFAPITQEFDQQFARHIPPAAQHLWKWLRRKAPPGREIEFDLKEFAATFDYTLKWARTALNILIEHQLVEEIRRFYSYGFRVKVFQVGDIGNKSSTNSEETSNQTYKTSQKVPSNPLNFDTNNKEKFREEQNQENPTTHPVQNEQGKILDQAKISQASEHQDLLQEIEQSGIKLNPYLEQIVLKATVQTVRNALESYREQRQRGNINKNPAGFFRRAVEQGFKPNSEPSKHRSLDATPIDDTQRELVRREYFRLGIEPPSVLAEVTYPPVRLDADLSDLLAQIRGYHRELGLQREEIEAHFQKRYGKSRVSLLSEEELADWLQHLQQNEGCFVLRAVST